MRVVNPDALVLLGMLVAATIAAGDAVARATQKRSRGRHWYVPRRPIEGLHRNPHGRAWRGSRAVQKPPLRESRSTA